MPSKLSSPFLIAGFLGITGLAAYVFSLDEAWTVWFILIFFALITISNPFNGVIFLLFSVPFLLGESGWPYYWITEALVFFTIFIAAIRLYIAKEYTGTPLKYILALLLITSLCSLPIDGKEFYYDFWAHSYKEMFGWWLSAHPGPKLHYLRVFTNMASGMAIFLITFHTARRLSFETLLDIFKAMTLICGIVCLVGIMMLYNIVPKNHDTWHYLTMSLVGNYQGAITAFAFALHFFNQYLMLLLPMTLYLIYASYRRPAWLGIYSAIFLAISFCVIQGGLRAAVLLLYLVVFCAIALFVFHLAKKHNKSRIVSITIVSVIVTFISGYLLTKGTASGRFADEILNKIDSDTINGAAEFIDNPLYFFKTGLTEPRLFLWHTAVMMFIASPLLGIGLGRYTHLFREYFASDFYNWGHIGFASGASAHSTYFEILADQGVLGLAIWGLLVITILWGASRAIGQEKVPEKKLFYIAIFSSVIIWLIYGLIHHMPLNRIIEIYFWVMLGFLAAYSSDHIKALELGRRKATVILAIILGALLFQFNLIISRPLPGGFSTGFNNWEKKPDGNYYRWMGKRGVYMAKAKDGKISLSLVVTLDGLEKEPQKVKMWVENQEREIIIPDRKLHSTEIPINSGDGEYLVWMEADHTYDPIERGIGRYGNRVSLLIQKPADK